MLCVGNIVLCVSVMVGLIMSLTGCSAIKNIEVIRSTQESVVLPKIALLSDDVRASSGNVMSRIEEEGQKAERRANKVGDSIDQVVGVVSVLREQVEYDAKLRELNRQRDQLEQRALIIRSYREIYAMISSSIVGLSKDNEGVKKRLDEQSAFMEAQQKSLGSQYFAYQKRVEEGLRDARVELNNSRREIMNLQESLKLVADQRSELSVKISELKSVAAHNENSAELGGKVVEDMERRLILLEREEEAKTQRLADVEGRVSRNESTVNGFVSMGKAEVNMYGLFNTVNMEKN